MKIRIFDTIEANTEEEELWLKLKRCDQEVTLIACNSKGERLTQGNMLTIGKDGISRVYAFNPQLGFTMNTDNNRINLVV